MSMLTPQGMGRQYRIKGNKYPRMRRPRRRGRLAVGLVASVAALGLIGWGTLQLIDVFTGGDKATAAGTKADCARRATPSASARAANPVKPGQITVNVLNATPRIGLAKKTADELKKRGFKIGDVGNAPKAYDAKVKAAGILLGAPASADGASRVLGTQLAGAQTKNDARRGKDVDLIIGSGFKDLVKQKDADKALTALTKPSPRPSGSPC
jgi:hypothetical protein